MLQSQNNFQALAAIPQQQDAPPSRPKSYQGPLERAEYTSLSLLVEVLASLKSKLELQSDTVSPSCNTIQI